MAVILMGQPYELIGYGEREMHTGITENFVPVGIDVDITPLLQAQEVQEYTSTYAFAPIYKRPSILDMVESNRLDELVGYLCQLPDYTPAVDEMELYSWLVSTYQHAEIDTNGLFREVERQTFIIKMNEHETPQNFKLKLHKALFPNTEALDPKLCWSNVKGYLQKRSVLLIVSGIEYFSEVDLGDFVNTTTKLGDKTSCRFFIKRGSGVSSQT